MIKRITNLAISLSLITSILINEHSYVYAMEEEIRKEKTGENDVFEIVYGDVLEASEEISFPIYENELVSVSSLVNEDYEQKRINSYDELVREYSDYFNLNEDSVIEIARNYTNDYKSSTNFFINGKSFNVNDKELFAMAIVYNIYSYPNDYGVDRSDILLDRDITNISYTNNDIILNNGYSFNSYVKYICDKICVDESLVLAIMNYETGYLSSNQALYKNNFGGLQGASGYITFPSPEAGIISMILNLDRIYEVYPINDIKDLSGAYVNGSVLRPCNHWVISVSSIQNDILINEEETFGYSLVKKP